MNSSNTNRNIKPNQENIKRNHNHNNNKRLNNNQIKFKETMIRYLQGESNNTVVNAVVTNNLSKNNAHSVLQYLLKQALHIYKQNKGIKNNMNNTENINKKVYVSLYEQDPKGFEVSINRVFEMLNN